MSNLDISWNGTKMSNGGIIPISDISQKAFAINWDPIHGVEYYTLKVQNIDTGKVYMNRANINDIDEGHDIEPEIHPFDQGKYQVSLYGQRSKINTKKSTEPLFPQPEALRQSTFEVGSLGYGKRKTSPISPSAPRKTSPVSSSALRKTSPVSSSALRKTSPVSSSALRKTSPVSSSNNEFVPISVAGRARGRSDIIISKKLPERERKYCSCLVAVGSQQTPACLKTRRWGEKISGMSCYSPHAVCKGSTKAESVECFNYYIFNAMNDAELVTLALQHNVDVPLSWNSQIGTLTALDRKNLIKEFEDKKK